MLVQGTLIGSYHVEEELGRGGMGTVFRARDTESGRLVALKLVTEGLRADEARDARLRGEGRAQAALQHPNVVTVYESGESDEGFYLAMQLVDGPSLAELLRERSVDARRALAILAQIAEALDAAHALGLTHRDVKPHNILVGAGDHAYLADFGLTRVGAQSVLTSPGTLVGTLAYVAPEVVRGADAGPASDRYAFAAVAFECLTGTVVFPRGSDAAVLHAHVSDPPPSLGARRAELGDHLDDVVRRALAKDPSERPASAVRFVEDVRRHMERAGTIDLPAPPLAGAAVLAPRDATTDSAVAPPLPPAPAPRPRERRRRALMLVVAALCGAAVAGAAWLAFGGESDDGEPVPDPAFVDRPGLRYVGSSLAGAPGRALDCRGRPATATSPGCSVVQAALPGATVVVPQHGVVRRWGVRGARGELSLSVLRPREGGAFQIALSSTETVGSADVHWFDTDMEVERGDLLALRVVPGSSVGVRDGVPGATTERWIPAVGGFGRPPDRGAGTGFDHELLLRVGLAPDATQRQPPQTTGSAAAALPAGRVARSSTVRIGGRQIEVALVRVGRQYFLDQTIGGRRRARIEVPGMRPRAQVTRFLFLKWGPALGGVDVSYVNEESARVVQFTYNVANEAFERVR